MNDCPHCKGSYPGAESDLPPSYMNELEKLRLSVIERVMKGEDPDGLLGLTIQTLSEGVISSFNPKGDFSTPDAGMLARLVRDVWHFSAAKDYRQMRDLTLALTDGDGKLREFADFKEAAGNIIEKYNINWLRTEYNFAVASAQSAARWAEFEKEASVIPNLKYQTVGDDHVRHPHRILHGIIRPAGDSFWDTHYPPNGWGCRCEALQSPDGYGRVTPDKDIPVVDIPGMFKTNLAKTGLIYPKSHPYYSGVPASGISRALDCLPPEKAYTSVTVDGCRMEIHPLHNDKGLARNIEAAKTLLGFEPEAKIKLLPVTGEKDTAARKLYLPDSYLKKYPSGNPDILYNNRAAAIREAAGSKASLRDAIRQGKEQADFVLIRIPDTINPDMLSLALNRQLEQYTDRERPEVWLFNDCQRTQLANE